MNNKTRGFLIAFVLLISTLSRHPAYAQEISINPITPEWDIPQIPCSALDYCSVISRVDQNGVLYVNSIDNRQLFIANPDGSQATMIDLGVTIDALSAGRFEHFVPFEDDTIVFDGAITISGYHLYIYNRESNLATQLDVSIPGILTTCEPNPYFQSRPFYRIGNNKIIVCSKSSDGVYNINVVNLSSLTVEETIPTRKNFHPSMRPWLKLEGGNDGNLYIQVYPGEFGMQFLDGVLVSIPNTHAYIARHTPGTQGWSIIPITESILSNLTPEADLDRARLVAVDELGNLYFSILWSAEQNYHTEFVKLSPAGEIIWHVTEVDFGERQYFEDLLSEDNFVTRTSIGLADLKVIQISSASPTLEPTLTIAP